MCIRDRHLVQFTPDPKPGDIIAGAASVAEFTDPSRIGRLKEADMQSENLAKVYAQITPQTPALIRCV